MRPLYTDFGTLTTDSPLASGHVDEAAYLATHPTDADLSDMLDDQTTSHADAIARREGEYWLDRLADEFPGVSGGNADRSYAMSFADHHGERCRETRTLYTLAVLVGVDTYCGVGATWEAAYNAVVRKLPRRAAVA